MVASFGRTAYARRDDLHLAYRISDGDGPDVIALMPGFVPLSAIGDAFARRFFDRIAGFGRVVLTERHGVGESDPVDPAQPPSLDEIVDDLLVVADAVGMTTPALFGFYNAGAVSIRLAARHPERVAALAVAQSFVCWEPKPDLDGVEAYFRERYAGEVEAGPPPWTHTSAGGDLDMLSIVAPSRSADPEFRAWWADVGRRGASPRSALAMMQADQSWDVRSDLATVVAPTVVVHRTENAFVPVSHARYAAAGIDGARLVEVPGRDHLGVVGDVDALLDPVEEFIAGRAPRRERMLAAVLFTDLVGSTARAVQEGDRSWTRLLAEHDHIVRDVVDANGGEVIKSTGDGALAVFASPAAAIRAARAIQARLAGSDLTIRAGIHAGEIERLANDVTGVAVTIAARVMAHAAPGEVLVSGAVPPLVAGSGLEFDDRGEVELKGIPGAWRVLRPL